MILERQRNTFSPAHPQSNTNSGRSTPAACRHVNKQKEDAGDGKNSEIKKTTDINVHPKDLKDEKFSDIKKYIDELHKCYLDYQEQWPFLKEFLTKVNVGPFNVQKYFPGDHFAALHSERTGLSTLHRIFAFMTYLNDVNDGGTTDFDHYGLKIKPENNKTLIWPAEWTHAHTGSVLKSGTKYIITGWFDFAS